ncbi:MAG TPA: type VI secretion system tube protein Hcp [Candidatus Limnocylindrales bacterium]
MRSLLSLAAALATAAVLSTSAPAQAATAAAADDLCQPPSPAAAGADYFLKLDGIPGESKDAQHRDEIEIPSWSLQDTAGCGPVASFRKLFDRSSPLLFKAATAGAHIPTAVLTGRKAGERPHEFTRFEFKDIVISSFQTGTTATAGDVLPMDSFSINYAQVRMVYIPQNADGTAGTPVETCWDAKAKRGC